jgi:hypothetical protein
MSTSQPKASWKTGRAGNWLLLAASVVFPVILLELALRPFANLEPEVTGVRKTSIFVEDRDLGWRLRPNADDVWSGARIQINAKGLRGPEIPYSRSPGTFRVLYLGDSVPFGYQLPRHDLSYPYLIETLLEKGEGQRVEVETVNAGVGGYSPWQYSLYLAREGIRYAPDLVVVSFILNDVTEKFGLVRFGGSSSGFQLARSTQSHLSRIVSRTAIGYFGRRTVARFRFGDDVEAGAKQIEGLRASIIATEPDRDDVRASWKITLANLTELFEFCAERGIPTLLVAFPYTFQFRDPAKLSAPQRVLESFATARGIDFLDLLPVYVQAMERSGESSEAFFLDKDHPTPRGHFVAATAISQRIRAGGILATPPR